MADKIVGEERARQGPKGRPVLMVLIGSLVLLGACLAFYMIWASRSPPDTLRQDAATSSGSSVSGTTGGAGNPSNRTPPANPAYPAPTDSSTGARPAGR